MMLRSESRSDPPADPPGPTHVRPLDPTDLLPYRPTNALAIVSLVLGIFWIFGIGSVLAVIIGHVARTQISRGPERGDGMAVTGIIFGWVGVVLMLLLLGFGSMAMPTEVAPT